MNKEKLSATDIFLVDMDGILADLHQKVAERYNSVFSPLLISKADFTHNSPALGVPVPPGRTRDETAKEVRSWLAEPGFYRDLEPLPHSIEALKEIQKMGFRPVILSSYGDAPGCVADKCDWLDKYFPFLNQRDRIFTSCKSLPQGGFFIDDGIEYLSTWKARNPEGYTLTLQTPYGPVFGNGTANFHAESWLDLVGFFASVVKEDSTRGFQLCCFERKL